MTLQLLLKMYQKTRKIQVNRPRDFSGTNQLPQGVSATNQLPQGVSATNQLPQGVSATNQLPQGVSATNQLPQGVSATNQLPQGVSATNQLPQGVSVLKESLQLRPVSRPPASYFGDILVEAGWWKRRLVEAGWWQRRLVEAGCGLCSRLDTSRDTGEIAQLFSGSFPAVRIQSECRCPSSYPREKPAQTQYCIKNGDRADTNDQTLRISRDAHPLEYANDGDSNSVWISSYQNKVDIDVDLGDQYQVFYVVLQFYSPFPKAVTIFRQKNDTSGFEAWQYYADDCSRFGLVNNGGLPSPDSVNCLQFGTNGGIVPYSLGNITLNLLALTPVARPGSSDFYNTPELQDFVKSTKVRVRLEDHYDYVTNVRHMYYALYELIITAWCDCNGHASQCNMTRLPYVCQCQPESYTEGNKCERCKPLYNNKPFRQGDHLQDYPCQPCVCNGHADGCVYNSTLDPYPQSPVQGGGGVCVNCQHFTTGIYCETCLDFYYRPYGVSLYDTNVCQPCDCYLPGLKNISVVNCAQVGGQCFCKTNVEGRRCDVCKPGFYNLTDSNPDGCLPCNCSAWGVNNGNVTCDQTTGQCLCKQNVRGVHCDECQFGSYNLSAVNPQGCTPCDCNPFGSTTTNCNTLSGQCLCKDKVEGTKCDRCKDGFFNFTSGCVPCNCNLLGTEAGTVCNKTNGQCTCKRNVIGLACNQCKEGTFRFGSSVDFGCSECTCLLEGTVNGTGRCDTSTGTCICKTNVEGLQCGQCKVNTWGLNASDVLGCQPCNCDATGTLLGNSSVCDSNTGQCACLNNRQGRRCDTCARGFYINPNGGCLTCPCYTQGTLQGTYCNSVTGQCECKEEFGVGGLQCNQCLPTFFAFDSRLGFCTACNCLPAGSLNITCNPTTGQCQCKPLVEGLACDRCKNGSSLMDANNPFGCSTTPSQLPQPDLINRTSTSFLLSWKRPDYPNGVILRYSIYRNNSVVGNTLPNVTNFLDSNLQPFTFYNYFVEVMNAFGSSRSPQITFQTLPGNPSNDMNLTVTDIRARSAFCTWTPPTNLNGPLLKYNIISVMLASNTTRVEWEGNSTSAMLTTLSPYTRYNLVPRACTVGGCTDSRAVQIITMSAAPEGQQPPNITALSSSELYVTWQPPLFPNGIIIFYELWMRGPLGPDNQYNPPASRIFNPSGRFDTLATPAGNPLDPPDTWYTVGGLQAYTTYEFQVYSQNDVSKAASPWVKGRTLEALPKYLSPPTTTGISNSELLITWTEPQAADMQGLVNIYRLYENILTDLTKYPFDPPSVWTLIYEGNSSTLRYVKSGLTPYSAHSFCLEACNSQGCINSTTVTGRTLLAAPEGVQRPQVDGFNTTVMKISWDPPLFPNGPPPTYRVQKTNIALSYPASVIRGTRFTGGGYYSFSPNIIPQNVAFTGIRLKFRLERGTGILLFSATSTQEEFIVVQFVNGRPRFMFDTQGCTNIAFITTTNDEGLIYNDRKWHTFEARRDGVSGQVVVDNKWIGSSNIRDALCTDTSVIGPTTGVYVGGFPAEFILRRTDKTRKIETTPFQGCIDNVEILTQKFPEEIWTKLDWTQGKTNDLAFLNWQGCPINLQQGFHFMGKGYLVIANCDDKGICDISGDKIEVRFRMRTTLHTGLLFLIYGGNGIYMYSVLDNRRLSFTISSNNYNTRVLYDRPETNLCDGQWRDFVFSKIGQQASIAVLQGRNVSVGDPNVAMSLSLTSDIFLGGLKTGSAALKYVQQNGLTIPGDGFGGCFSGFAINTKEYEKDMIVVDVDNTNLDGCPPYHDVEITCQSSLITEIYNGTDTVAYETGLLPYTDYIYRVVASNSAGEGYSSWAYGRTREGAPSGVKAPISVRTISGYEVEVIWLEPEITYGLLTKYVIMAYMVNSTSFVSMDILDVSLTAANMTGVIPDTTYLIKMKACTPGGCTESIDGMQVTMLIEAPENVSAPTADAGPNYLLVKWTLPGKPNGPITGFVLYKEGAEVYKGGQLSYNVTGLQVYTAYRFYVSACTVAGCTSGPSVALSTLQLPPTSVGQPRLLVLGTSQIDVSWDKPSELNGVLESYLLYASTVEDSLGDVVYNSSVFIQRYVLTGLMAGTKYYITLGACTGGGCTVGQPASATTKESAPDGVPLPVVVALSTSELLVTWDPPKYPNGAIIRYVLVQNGIQVQSGLTRSYTSTGLEPYSRHIFRVEACTALGCASSGQVEMRTKEAPPIGLIVLNANVVSSRSVNVSWTVPEKPNGFLMYQTFFTGLFYIDTANWNYSVVSDRRLLLNATAGYITYLVTNLLPMSTYSIQINGTNSVGFILSNSVNVTLPPGTPDGVAPPKLVSDTPRSVKVTWMPAGRVNANEAVAYLLQFMETSSNAMLQNEFGPTTTLSYTKMNLVPYTEYKFRIIASNSYGDTTSDWSSVVTKQDKPALISPPVLTSVKSRYIDIVWSAPLSPNGLISNYNIYLNGVLRSQVAGNMSLLRVDNLTPYTDYMFEIEACTDAGCTKSIQSPTVRTLEDIPEDLMLPTLRAVSPSAIEIVYQAPQKPNGVITQYIIERKVGNTDNATVVSQRIPQMAMTFIDESNSLMPFTVYNYRVNVGNGAGVAMGPWAQVTTGSSRPAGVNPPQVTILSPTSALVQWVEPLQLNGQIEVYVVSFPNPRIEIRNTTQHMVAVTNLTPYTQYAVTLTACTSGGCTESVATLVTTTSAIPSGLGAPVPTAISQSRISILWQPPLSPNGPNITYELSRIKVRQPLDTTVTDIGIWLSVYRGTSLFYEDTNLPMFTTYIYRTTVFNRVGQMISPNSTEATTYGGLPRLPANVTAVARDHLSIIVNWTLPSPVDLQGEVQSLTLQAMSSKNNVTVSPSGNQVTYVVDTLEPNTDYTVTLTVTIFGGAYLTSQPVLVKTKDGAPAGLSPPQISVVSTNSLRIAWAAPGQPNGEIVSYTILVNDRRIPTGSKYPGSAVVSDLQPFTIYDIKIEACTVYACAVSPSTLGATAEAPPQDMAPPIFTSVTPVQVLVLWSQPIKPNGVILRYDLWRKTNKQCTDMYVHASKLSTSRPPLGQLVSKYGRKCCGGKVIYDSTICCGLASQGEGQMYLQQPGYVCCGQEYVESKLTLCCVSDNNVTKTHYYGSEQEKLMASDKCCGVSRVSKNLACCNNVGYNPISNVCADKSFQVAGCGTGVVCPISQQSTAYCNRCDFDTSQRTCGFIKSSEISPTTPSSNLPSTCTSDPERIYSGLSLNYTDLNLVPYSLYEYSVVVVNSAGSTSSSWATIRTLVAPPEQVLPPSSRVAPGELFAIYLTWTEPQKPNGIISNYILRRDGIQLYSGLGTNFTDDLNILPYRSYSYILTACNVAGCGTSDVMTVATAQAIPENLVAPYVTVVNSTQIVTRAQPPGSPNGLITLYTVYIVGTQMSYNSTLPEEFTFTGLKPYTSYTLEMRVCTIIGCATSPNVTVKTTEDLPEGLSPPRIIVISPSVLELYWHAPVSLNGILLGYRITQTRPQPVTVVYFGSDTMSRLTNLTPGQTYTYQLDVSNGAGSTSSIPRDIVMPWRSPLNIPVPQNVTVLSSTSIQVKWLPITSDQGDIDNYKVLLNIGLETEVERGVGLDTSIVISPLLPYTKYEVRLQACLMNVLNGCGTSSGVLVQTMEDMPLGMANPRLQAVASNAVLIQWVPPSTPNGNILVYRIFQRKAGDANTEILVNQVQGNVSQFLHSGQDIKPFQFYEYRVLAENSKGSISSNWSSIQTLQAAPTNLSSPIILSVSSYGVTLSWALPLNPNGIIQEYRIYYQISTGTSPSLLSVGGNVTSTTVSNLEAYTSYILYMEAVNIAGSVRSPGVSFTTREGYPSGLGNFNVEKVNTGLSVILTWDAPTKPNGIITMYRIYENGSDIALYTGLGQQFEYRRLLPASKYFVKLEACTKMGCTNGQLQSFWTAEIAPSAQPSPVLGNVTSRNVQLLWKPPVNPNGVITAFEVLRVSNSLSRKRRQTLLLEENEEPQSLFSIHHVMELSYEACHYLPMYHLIDSGNYLNYIPQNYSIHSPVLSCGAIVSRSKRQTTSDPQVVYRTTNTSGDQFEFTDTNLQPYSSYQYSIRACNSLGCTSSPWQSVTTSQAPPIGVQPPTLQYVSNEIGTLNVTWSAPTQMNGVLQSYQIQRNTSLPLSFSSDAGRQFLDSGLLPYTVYSYKLTACTGGGCTTSLPATLRTLETSPFLVPSPTVQSVNSTVLRVTWTKPLISNGEIIQYKLKMDGSFIYSGLEESFTILYLKPYEQHVFRLTACTNGGCTESGDVTGRTEDASPTGLSPPLLRVLSSNSIEITWSAPSNPNGIITSYYIRRDSRLIYISDGMVMTKIDYSLEPGQEYSYTIIAENRKGSIESDAARAVTYSASPSGLAAPIVTSVSSTSIKVDWTPPTSPNGAIVNYTVYQGNTKVYTGPATQLTYTVPGLQYYTQYTFSVEACTNRGCQISQSSVAMTLEALPEGQPQPTLLALADELGAHAGIQISWEGPVKPNGIIVGYELRRRSVLNVAEASYTEPVNVFNGSSRTLTDTSSELKPYTQYQYMVIATNSVGKTGSLWASVTTKEASPQGVLPPVVNSTTSTTITVTVPQPTVSNGIIKFYRVLVNDTVLSASPLSAVLTVGLSPPLSPYTLYNLKSQLCTSAGCATSTGVLVKTDSAKSTGLASIRITATTNDSITLEWAPPLNPNGVIQRYEVYQRKTCPPTVQPFNQTCILGDISLTYSGLNLSFTVGNLEPYTVYSFQVQCFNDKGGTDFNTWVSAETKPSIPIYLGSIKLYKNGTMAKVNWENSFDLNGQLREFLLLADGIVVFRGVAFEGGVERKTKSQAISFIVQAITSTGQAESPVIVFDPSAVDNIGTTTLAPVAAEKSSSTPVYQEIWFIVLMCILALLVLFIVLALCIRCNGSNKPYIRERMPLHHNNDRTLPRGLYVIDAADGSIIDGLSPRRRKHLYQGPGIGLVNPAFVNERMSPSRFSRAHTKYFDSDSDDMKPYDSGLFDDLDSSSSSGHTYSYTKEQTVFTDTHL
uniref:Usherin n=1 Tax=Biomphalaria glabrata TaxID=6526 RepID=A0A2C9JJ39_BIOGL